MASFTRGLAAALLAACGESAPAQRPADGAPLTHAPVEALALATPDTTVRAAQAALARRQPWEATRLLAPLLADPARRTPEAVLVAAQAAARWGGWGDVERLLAPAPWLDSLAGGEGRELLARAALARRTPAGDSLAAAHARRSLAGGAAGLERGVRLVLLARALDRAEPRAAAAARPALADSAAAAYETAAALLPGASDWLRLRAAGVRAGRGERGRLYAAVRVPAARARTGFTEAQALERFGELAAAEAAYDSLGDRAAALALRLRARPAERDAVRAALARLVTERAGTTAARDAADLLDRSFAPLTPAEELAVARSARAAGPLARAASGYAAALAGGAGTEQDRFAHAELLFRLGRHREAVTRLEPLAAGPRGGAADYLRARALLRAGEGARAVALLREIAAVRAADTAAVGSALFLLGDLATDEGRDAAARAAFRDMARRYPTHPLASGAAFRAAIIALAAAGGADAARGAAGELDALAAADPRGAELLAATYWAGRGWAAAGDRGRARERWEAVIAREPASYYALLAARRLGVAPWLPPDTVPPPLVPADVAAAMQRAALLDELDMDVEARFERDRVLADAGSEPARLLGTARAFRDAGLASPGIRLAERALARGAPRSAELYRLLYPVVFEASIAREGRTRGVEPALVAGLIRQESNFTPWAASAAGARGLMQLLPSVGARVAQALRVPAWDPVLLYQPDVNVRLGAAHLAGVLRRYPHPAYALADYNAGGSRVRRWRIKPGSADPELFTERIPYAETRDYVRIVLRNRELYGGLYEGLGRAGSGER